MPQAPLLPTTDRRLVRKLAVVIVIKLIAIFALWWLFVRDERVPVTPDTVVNHLWQSPESSTQGNSHGQ
jgi:multidrug resistance efflux pump